MVDNTKISYYNMVKVREMTESKQEEKQMVDIIKSLADNELAIPIIILGLVPASFFTNIIPNLEKG